MRDALESCNVVEITHQRLHQLEHGDLGGVQIDRDSSKRAKHERCEDRPEGEVMEHFPGAIETTSMETAKIRLRGAEATSSSAQPGQVQAQRIQAREGQQISTQ